MKLSSTTARARPKVTTRETAGQKRTPASCLWMSH